MYAAWYVMSDGQTWSSLINSTLVAEVFRWYVWYVDWVMVLVVCWLIRIKAVLTECWFTQSLVLWLRLYFICFMRINHMFRVVPVGWFVICRYSITDWLMIYMYIYLSGLRCTIWLRKTIPATLEQQTSGHCAVLVNRNLRQIELQRRGHIDWFVECSGLPLKTCCTTWLSL